MLLKPRCIQFPTPIFVAQCAYVHHLRLLLLLLLISFPFQPYIFINKDIWPQFRHSFPTSHHIQPSSLPPKPFFPFHLCHNLPPPLPSSSYLSSFSLHLPNQFFMFSSRFGLKNDTAPKAKRFLSPVFSCHLPPSSPFPSPLLAPFRLSPFHTGRHLKDRPSHEVDRLCIVCKGMCVCVCVCVYVCNVCM